MPGKTKAVYFSSTERDLLNWAEQYGNFSRYIKELIKNDKDVGEGLDPRVRELVERLVEAKLVGNAEVLSRKSEVDRVLIENLF